MNSSHHTLRLILGDQLNPKHSWYKTVNLQIVYVLMEVRQETDYVLQHTQKILAIFAAMRDFAKQLKTDGHCVHYLALDNPENLQSVSENLNALVRKFECQRVEWQSPDEWRLDEMLRKWALGQSLETNQVDSEHFITARHELSECIFHGIRPSSPRSFGPPFQSIRPGDRSTATRGCLEVNSLVR